MGQPSQTGKDMQDTKNVVIDRLTCPEQCLITSMLQMMLGMNSLENDMHNRNDIGAIGHDINDR